MRTIKFRGAKSGTHEWLYSDSIMVDTEGRTDQPMLYDESVKAYVYIVPGTLGEFSGLYDESGFPIYEGDIVKWRSKRYEVCFQAGMFYAAPEGGKNMKAGHPLCDLTLNSSSACTIEDKIVMKRFG